MTTIGADFEYVRTIVREQAAIVLEPDKQYLVEARLAKLATKEGFASPQRLISQLRAHPTAELIKKVVDAMTTNETLFFRDGHPFEALRRQILPDLISARAGERVLNLWCGASSTGQEPYSILMVLREHFPALANWTVNFLATDLCTEVVSRARAGVFNQLEVSRGLPAPLLAKYFVPHRAAWQIRDDLRRAIEFRELNLCKAWGPMPQMDLVFLRNVLIYFDVEMKRTVLARVRGLMRPGAYLLTGSSETTLGLDDGFVPVNCARTVCYKLRSNARPIP